MRTFLVLLAVAVLPSSLHGEVAEGENLLINGTFDAEQVEFQREHAGKRLQWDQIRHDMVIVSNLQVPPLAGMELSC